MIILDTHIWFWFINQEFDRIIIATTLEYKAQLASIDTLFSKYIELEKYLLKKIKYYDKY